MRKTDRGSMMGRHFCMNIGLKLFNYTNLSNAQQYCRVKLITFLNKFFDMF